VSTRIPIVILGAGPAGAGAAFKLAKRGRFDVLLVERNSVIGGNAGSFDLEGFRVDYGSHRLHPSCDPAILTDIRTLLGDQLLSRPRHGRIRLGGRWLRFPLRPLDLAVNVPLSFSIGVARDAVVKRRRPAGDENFATVLEASLGSTICREFYFPYAEKVWGLDPGELAAEQARRRVSAGSIGKMVRKVLSMAPGMRKPTTGIFFYPRRGFGSISEAYGRAAVEAGARIDFGATLTALERRTGQWNVRLEGPGGPRSISTPLVLSTVPVTVLAKSISDPAAPAGILAAASSLRYRAMVLIYVVLETDRFSEFDAHNFPELKIAITRMSEPKNYSLTGPSGLTVLCAELPCSTQDPAWTASNTDLLALVRLALRRSGLEITAAVRRVEVRRLPQAYPIYTRDYRRNLAALDGWLGALEGIVSFGRQGLFAHDNTHHALAMAYALNECVGDTGRFDSEKWAGHRAVFEKHVVED